MQPGGTSALIVPITAKYEAARVKIIINLRMGDLLFAAGSLLQKESRDPSEKIGLNCEEMPYLEQDADKVCVRIP